MKSFKSLREEALEKVKTAKVFDSKKSAENEKGKAFEKKGKVATKDEGDLEYGADNNKVHVTEALTSVGRKYEELYDTHYQKKFKEGRKQGMSPEDADKHAHKSLDDYKEQIRTGKIDPIGDMKEDIDQEYSDWQDSVKKKNPEHADKIKFKSNPDQRHVISAEHGDRSFGTFNMKTGESEHLGEEVDQIDEVSKTTLVSYIKKAARSAAEAGNVAGFKAGRKQPKYNVSDETPTEIKRHRGIALAARKLSEAITMKGSIDQDAVNSHLEKISKKHGCTVDYLEKQLLKGKKVEQEHTDDMDVATKVALDHLAEKPDYYKKLEKVEGK